MRSKLPSGRPWHSSRPVRILCLPHLSSPLPWRAFHRRGPCRLCRPREYGGQVRVPHRRCRWPCRESWRDFHWRTLSTMAPQPQAVEACGHGVVHEVVGGERWSRTSTPPAAPFRDRRRRRGFMSSTADINGLTLSRKSRTDVAMRSSACSSEARHELTPCNAGVQPRCSGRRFRGTPVRSFREVSVRAVP